VADTLYLAFLTTLLLAVALAAAVVQPEWAHDLSLDRWDVSALDVVFGDGPAACKQHEDARAMERLLGERQRIVNDLLEGRMTAAEAADAFRRLNEHYGKRYAESGGGPSEEECVRRHLLRWVRAALRERSPHTAEYRAALIESELRGGERPEAAGATP
jgi:hypothetical protein